MITMTAATATRRHPRDLSAPARSVGNNPSRQRKRPDHGPRDCASGSVNRHPLAHNNSVRRAIGVAVLLLATAFSGGCSQVRWRPDLGGALRMANRTNNLVFVAYWSPLNEDCNRMERDVFSHDDVVATLRTTIPVRLDAMFNRSFAKTYDIAAPPAFVIFGPDGRVLRVLRGYVAEGRLRGAIEAARFAK